MIRLKLVIMIAGLSLFIVACNQKNNQNISSTNSSKDTIASPDTIVVLKDTKIQGIYTHYNHLKNALIASDSVDAKKAGNELAKALVKISGCENTAVVAQKIGNSTNINDQRLNFIPLSSDIVALLKHAEIVSGEIYVDYCPMANDGKGAYWLASASKIRNPYYGDDMVNCGEIKEEIKKK